ncbi:MAG: universal stress protein [Bacteroidetes bacterium]|nr:universal stress protein [Bacteroidota bacterium]
MRRKLLIFIEDAENPGPVLDFGLMLAKKLDQRAVLVEIQHLPLDVGQGPVPTVSFAGYETDVLENRLVHSEEALRSLQAKAIETWPHTSIDVEAGFALDEIQELAKGMDVSMLLMQRRKYVGKINEWFGSLATDFVENLDCPVFVLPPDLEWKQPNRLLYMLSANDDLKHLGLLKDFINAFGGDILLVMDAKDTIPEHDPKYVLNLSTLKHAFEASKLKYQTIYDHESDRIFELQKNKLADWIICPKTESDFFSRVFGNVPERDIVLYSEVPVLAI